MQELLLCFEMKSLKKFENQDEKRIFYTRPVFFSLIPIYNTGHFFTAYYSLLLNPFYIRCFFSDSFYHEQKEGHREISLISCFMLVFPTVKIMMDQVACMLLYKANAVTWRYLEIEKSIFESKFFSRFHLKSEIHTFLLECLLKYGKTFLIILLIYQLGLILERIIIMSKLCTKPYYCFKAAVFSLLFNVSLLFCRLERKSHEFILDKSDELTYKKT